MEDSFRRANCCTIVFNLWQCRFICKTSRANGVEKEDLMRMSQHDDSECLRQQIENQWDKQRFKQNPSFMKAFHRAFLCRFLRISFIGVLSESLPPLYLYITKLFIDFVGDAEASTADGISLVGIFTFLLILSLIFRHLFFFYNAMFGVVMRKALTSFLYQKLLRLSQSSVAKASPGKLINMASGDMAVIERGFTYLPYVIVSPLASLINLTFLYFIIGTSVFYALIVVGFVYVLQFPINRYLVKIRLSIAQASDRRLNVVNKLILGMRTIKSYAWEDPIIKNAKDARHVECRRFLKQFCVKGASDGVFRNSVTLLWMPVILIKVAQGEQLVASSLFSAMNMLASLGFTTIFFLNLGMNSAAEYSTVIKRIQDVLLLEEIKDRKPDSGYTKPEFRVKMEKVFATWGFLKASSTEKDKSTQGKNAKVEGREGLKEPLLQNVEKDEDSGYRSVNANINFEIRDGQLLGVIGKVGSGKSSLLATVMGETQVTSGVVDRSGRVAYVEQEPCILSDSVRNNITFGLPLNEERLNKVIEVCELKEDLKLFARGLDTEIGERGVNISGGQKARLSLARACYSNAEIFLLDDPLSAVDPSVAQKIFSNCIRGFLEEKARILVTHQLSFLHRVDSVLMLENGNQSFLGTYNELKQFECERGTDLCDVLEGYYGDKKRKKTSVDVEEIEDLKQEKEEEKSRLEEEEKDKKKTEDLIVAEQKSAGGVKLSTYGKFFGLSCGWIVNILLILFSITTAVIGAVLRYFIAYWVTLPFQQQQEPHYSWYYAGISIASILTAMCSSLSIMTLVLYISNRLHNKMLIHVARAPILFFDSNPLGRIINRFSKDAAVVDGTLPMQLIIFLGILLGCIMLMAMTVSVYPYLGVVVVVLIALMMLIRKLSLTSTMDSLRYDAITRSPINSMFSASLNGLMTIRAYAKEAHFQRVFTGLVDTNGCAFFTYNASARWMAYYLDYVSALFILCTIVIAIVLKSEGTDPAYVALGITSALSLSGPFQFFIRSSADVSNSMTSVQRMEEYAELKSEPPQVLPRDNELKGKWPKHGEICFNNAFMRYRQGFDPVLKNINFLASPGMKVGVVGRTGAGKSSLLQALFRLSEIDKGSEITIDKIDTSQIGLKLLRESISIIPQSPFIFEGTVRENLDPFSLYTDQAIWSSLDDVQLKDAIESMELGLKQPISEGTSVFSVGQKQLICLARAILRENKILVLDEATANVDMDTDSLIQQTIKRKFSDCTILTVAHRLDTIIESDRILVLSKGEALEYDHPHVLLQKKDGHFTGMVAATGQRSEMNLRQKAEEAYNEFKK